jgi:hypothetical protein
MFQILTNNKIKIIGIIHLLKKMHPSRVIKMEQILERPKINQTKRIRAVRTKSKTKFKIMPMLGLISILTKIN